MKNNVYLNSFMKPFSFQRKNADSSISRNLNSDTSIFLLYLDSFSELSEHKEISNVMELL